jgi:hypothetical protein
MLVFDHHFKYAINGNFKLLLRISKFLIHLIPHNFAKHSNIIILSGIGLNASNDAASRFNGESLH